MLKVYSARAPLTKLDGEIEIDGKLLAVVRVRVMPEVFSSMLFPNESKV